MSDSKIKDNTGKIVTEFLFGIISSMEGYDKVTKDAVRGLTTIDRDFLAVMSHKVSSDNIVKWTENCPYCKQPNDITEDLDPLKVRFMPQSYENRFELTFPRPVMFNGVEHKDASIVLPNGWVHERVAPFGRNNPAQASTTVLQMITHRLGTLEMPIDVNVFRKMSSKNRAFINKFVDDMKLGVDLEVTEYCAECGERFTTIIPLNALLGE